MISKPKMLLGLASLQKENTLNEVARKLLNLIILPAIIMASISLVKYPCQKNSRCRTFWKNNRLCQWNVSRSWIPTFCASLWGSSLSFGFFLFFFYKTFFWLVGHSYMMAMYIYINNIPLDELFCSLHDLWKAFQWSCLPSVVCLLVLFATWPQEEFFFSCVSP